MGKLLRNREIRLYLLALLPLAAAGLGILFYLDPRAGAVTALLLLGVLALTLRLLYWRYRKIAGLSDCLVQIANGQYHVDMKEYADGELSILASEILKVTRVLSHQAEMLQKDKTYLADAISDISHQLKTPLTSVSMMAELLADPDGRPEKREEFLSGILSGVERIRWLVAALLKLSRLDAGAVIFKREHIAAPQLVAEAAAPLKIAMELKNQRFTAEGSEDVSLTGDLGWLAEALGNLLKNCVEHTPEGGNIQVEWQQNPIYTQFTVSDNGPGIDAEDLPRIFERFYKGKNAGADSVGIGLALSKTIVTRQGGSLEAANGPGGGAVFTVKLYN